MDDKAAGLWRSACAVLLALALALVAALPASARSVLELDVARQPVQMLDWGDAWLDPTGSAPVETVATSDKIAWEPTHDHAIYPLTTGKSLWIRFTIPPAPDAERWYLEIPYSAVNRVTLYTPDSIGKWLPQEAGDMIAVADWPVPHRHPLMPVVVSAEEPRKFLLRVENPHSFGAPLSFVSESYLSRHEQQTSLILGIYFGLAGLAVAVALLSALSLRDRAYALYALSVALMAFSQAALTGIGGLHLWPHWPVWNDLSSMVFPSLTVGSLLWFFSEVVSIPERSPRLHRVLVVLALTSVPIGALIALIEPSLRFRVMVPYVMLITTVAVAVVIWAARRGDRYGLWLIGGMAPVIIGACFPTARLLGFIPISFWTMHGMQIGIAVELPVLLVILMLRSQQRREHHRRMQGLDRIDPATGLINSYVFRERLIRMMHRCERLKYQSAILMIDIANSDQIRRDFGQRAADELPLLVAGRLLSSAREIDSVARLGELRFGLLMEGPMNEEDAASAGPRVVARCLMPFKNKPIDWVARVRVGLTVVPTERADADGVLQRLEALLAAVPPESKRAVFTLRS